MKLLMCCLFGHRISRPEIYKGYPVISYEGTHQPDLVNHFVIDFDYCSRCGCLVGRINRPNLGEIKKIEVLASSDM